ncbi:MAG: UDP-N-acetylglucosamine 1-carboxyvinyltransferase [bacterium JZ-2024 1]
MPQPFLHVEGEIPLKGVLKTPRSKNAILPIMAASLLMEGKVRIRNVPRIRDMDWMMQVLKWSGVQAQRVGSDVEIEVMGPPREEIPSAVTRKLRASFLVLGPLTARWGKVRIHRPGGCAIGVRPIQFHLQGLEKFGARVEERSGVIEVTCTNRLRGNKIHLDYPSVGATENLVMAAVLAKGETEIYNVAQEPEVVDLCQFLNSAGAQIDGIGSSVLRIRGVPSLKPVDWLPTSDRIAAGTYLASAAITGGEIFLQDVDTSVMTLVLEKLAEMGCSLEVQKNSIHLKAPERLKPVHIQTQPYPGFPTDLQPIFMACLAIADGVSTITETVFERRFNHVDELWRMGAKILVKKDTATIEGVKRLSGAEVMASDIRGGAALLLAALAASHHSRIRKVHHILRGYEDPVALFSSLGAHIRWESPSRKNSR